MVQVKLLDICDVYQPQTISTKQFVKDGKYLVYGANGVIGRYSKYNHKDSEVVMGCRGACGAIHISLPYSWINGNAMVIHPNGKMPLSKKYLQYFMIFANKDSIISGTAQPQITRQNMKDFTIPICSVESQERIVSRIEELFSELDNGAETLKKTKEQLAVYKQAVLKEAFKGKLTCEWRKEHLQNDETDIWDEICRYKTKCGNNNKYAQDEHIELPSLPKGWKWISVGDISHGVEYGTSKKSLKNGKVPVIRMGNIQNGSIDWSDLVYSDDEDEISKYSLTKGDVLFNRTNSPELVRKTAVYNGGRKAIFAGYLIRINQFPCIDANYLTYYLNSYTAKKYGNKVKTDGVNQSNINGKNFAHTPFRFALKRSNKGLFMNWRLVYLYVISLKKL